MRTMECEICGRIMPVGIPPLDVSQIKLSIITNGYYYRMCDDCKESLQNWLYRRHNKIKKVSR